MNNKEKEALAIIKPEHVFDFDLITKIIPSVRVGERVMRLDTIEHVEYAFDPDLENPDPAVVWTEKDKPELAISHASGAIYYFEEKEAIELESQIKATIKRSEDMQQRAKQEQQEMMTQAAQEAYRRELQQVQVPNLKGNSAFGKFRK